MVFTEKQERRMSVITDKKLVSGFTVPQYHFHHFVQRLSLELLHGYHGITQIGQST